MIIRESSSVSYLQSYGNAFFSRIDSCFFHRSLPRFCFLLPFTFLDCTVTIVTSLPATRFLILHLSTHSTSSISRGIHLETFEILKLKAATRQQG